MVLTMHYMRFDETRGKCVRTPSPSLLMVTCTECNVEVVYFCATFKTLLMKHYNIRVEVIAITVSQDMPVFTRDGLKEAWPDSLVQHTHVENLTIALSGRRFVTKIMLKTHNVTWIFC